MQRGAAMKQKKDKRKYKGALKLMVRGTPNNPEYLWVEEHEIKGFLPFSWRLLRP